MAEAKPAPLKKEVLSIEDEFLAQEFNTNIKYMFQLAVENPDRENVVWDMRINRPAPKQKFKPYQNIVLTSQIVWKGRRRNLRYYDGCDSIFQDEQPKEKETVDQLIAGTRRRHFENGKFGAFGDERMLLLYLIACSWNGESPFKTRTSDTVFIPVDQNKAASIKSDRLDRIEQAIMLAKNADDKKMLIHANYLGIPTTDWDSGNELDISIVRTEYRESAANNPTEFVRSFNDKTIEVKYFVEKALETGTISTKSISNKAAWKTGTVICDISGIKTPEGISQKLIEFSQLPEGEDFLLQLKALYN